MFKLEIETTNEAFDPYPSEEVARLLKQVARWVSEDMDQGTIRDINGNVVGSFKFTPEDY